LSGISGGGDESEGQASSSGEDSGEVDGGVTTSQSGSESTGPVVVPEPEIVDLELDPDAPKSAGPVVVTVQAMNAAEVWMTVDDGSEVALEPVGDEGTEFVGEIAVLGESWNGSHTVSAVARAGELESPPWEEMFTVTAPPAGSEVWKEMSTVTPSFGNAVAFDAQGEVYELFTEWGNQGMRCHVRRRGTLGEAVWPQDAVALAAGVACIGEDIKVAPDGTLWVLVNTVEDEVDRWQLFNLDPDGVLLDDPQVGGFEEVGRGIDVNAAGDLLLCGSRPGVGLPDAWVKLMPQAGMGWTRPWVHEVGNEKFDERTKDCAFVEDRIVVVGEVFGRHDPNNIDIFSRGFVVEFAINGVNLFEAVATDEPAMQSGYEAVAPDGDSGYAAAGYTCNTKVVPCSPKMGVVKWFSWGASMTWEQPVAEAVTVSDVAPSASGGMVVAAQAVQKEQGISGSGMGTWPGRAGLGVPGHTQLRTTRHRGRAWPLRVPRGGRLLSRRRYARGRGRHLAPLLTGHEHAAGV
jgi:hypothetical protein